MNIKKIVLFLLVLSLVLITPLLNAEDEEGVKFPGKFGLEFKSQLDSDIINGTADRTSLSCSNSDLYFRNELKGKVQFKIADFYKLTPWLKDRFDLKFDYNAAATDSIKLQPRNRFYAGVDNLFVIKDVMDIGANFELRVANQVNKNMEVRISPILYLGGKYKNGLSWSVNSLFSFYLDPKKAYDVDNGFLFKKFNFEIDKVKIAYEFFHFFAPKQVKCSYVAEMYLLATAEAGKARQDDIDNKVAPNDMLANLEFFTGLKFGLWKMSPYAGFFGAFTQYYQDNGHFTTFSPGFKMGIGFKKDWFSANIEYIGVIQTYDSNADNQEALAERTVYEKVKAWENHISAYIKIKI